MKHFVKKNFKAVICNISLLDKFIHFIMEKGKKKKANNILISTFIYIHEQSDMEPLEVLKKAIKNTTPVYLQIIPNTQIQTNKNLWHKRLFFKSTEACTIQAIKWIIKTAREVKGKPFYICLAQEIIEASKNYGKAIKYKEKMENDFSASQLHLQMQ